MISGIHTASLAPQLILNNPDPSNVFPMILSVDVSCQSASPLAGVVVDVKWNDGSVNRLKRFSIPLTLLSNGDSQTFPVEVGPSQNITVEAVLSTGLGSPSYKLALFYNQPQTQY